MMMRTLMTTTRNQVKKHREEDTRLVVTALRAYYDKYGHIAMSPTFTIPATNDEWPLAIHEFNLGKYIHNLFAGRIQMHPDIERELESMKGHAIMIGTHWKEWLWFATTFAALEKFASLNGHLCVRRSFIVPKCGSEEAHLWPQSTWGLSLGMQVHSLRQAKRRQSLTVTQREALERIGFVWDVMEYQWQTQFMPSLYHFHAIHGHCHVPQAYIVPITSQLPSTCHRYPLGVIINRIRRGDTFTRQLQTFRLELEALQFSFNSVDTQWADTILPALETFASIYHHCNIEPTFIVPEHPPWPVSSYGSRLGYIVQNMRNRGDYVVHVFRDRARLDAIGFVWNREHMQWQTRILPSLQTYVEIHGHPHVPRRFVVPTKAPWPVEAAGLRLGRIVCDPKARRRYMNDIEVDREILEGLGYSWSVWENDDIVLSDSEYSVE